VAGVTFGKAVQTFSGRPTARLLAGALVLAVAGRVARGGLGLRDLLTLAAVALAQPFVEWLVHVYVLHARPFTLRGRVVDVGASHRLHHADPRDLAHVFVDVRFLVATFALDALLFERWPTLVVAILAGTLAYEWTHYLIHTDYHPRSAAYRRIRTLHLRHHYKDETAWFGVTSHLADRVLRTTL
jgi:hypothetical protein